MSNRRRERSSAADERPIVARGYYDVEPGLPRSSIATAGRRALEAAPPTSSSRRSGGSGRPGAGGAGSALSSDDDGGGAGYGAEAEAAVLRAVGLDATAAGVLASARAGQRTGYVAGAGPPPPAAAAALPPALAFSPSAAAAAAARPSPAAGAALAAAVSDADDAGGPGGPGGGGARAGRRASIGQVTGIVSRARNLRDVPSPRLSGPPASSFEPRFLGAEHVDTEAVPPAPPELANKLLALVEKVVAYKDRLAQEQAARAAVEERLREVHRTVIGSLRSEVRAHEDAAIQAAEAAAVAATRAVAGATAYALGAAGLADAAALARGAADPLFDEGVEMGEQLLDGRAAAAARRRGGADAPDAEADATAALARSALARKGLGGGVGADASTLSLAARLQPDPDRYRAVLAAARARLAATAARERAAARRVLLEGRHDADGADVTQAALGAGLLGGADADGELGPPGGAGRASAGTGAGAGAAGAGAGAAGAGAGAGEGGVGLDGLLMLSPADEVDALLAAGEGGGVRPHPAMTYSRWLERAREGLRRRERAGAGGAPGGPHAAADEPPPPPPPALLDKPPARYVLARAAGAAVWCARAGASAAATGRCCPFHRTVARLTLVFGPTAGASFVLARHAVALLLGLALVAGVFSLHHWAVSAGARDWAPVAATAPRALLPSSYAPAEAGVLAGQLVVLFALALFAPLAWWARADRRARAATALASLVGHPRYSRAVFGALDLRGYADAAAAAEARFATGDELSALLQDDVLSEVGAAGVAAGARPLAELAARRALGWALYAGLLAWLLYLTAQLMLATSLLHTKLVAASAGAEAAGAAWVEALTPAGVAVLLWFFPRVLILVAGVETWGSHAAHMAVLSGRLAGAHVLAALVQVLGYVLLADPYLLRAPAAAFFAAFPGITTDADGLVRALAVRVALARPFFPAAAGGAGCRLDAAAAGLSRLLVATFVVNRVGSVLSPVASRAGHGTARCARACAVALRDAREAAPPPPGAPAGAGARAQLGYGGGGSGGAPHKDEGGGGGGGAPGTVAAAARSWRRRPEHNPAVAAAEVAHFCVLALSAIAFAPLASVLAAALAVAAFAADAAVLRACRSRPRRPWPGSGRAAGPLFHGALFLAAAAVAALHAGVLSSTTLPRACGVQGPALAAALGGVPASAALVRYSDPYCTALNDTLPVWSTTLGWMRTGLNRWEDASPWRRAAAAVSTDGTPTEWRRRLLGGVAGEEALYWMDAVCPGVCAAAQAAYIANHTGAEADVASDVFFDGAWCASHCAGAAAVIPSCTLAATWAVGYNATTGAPAGVGPAAAPAFFYRWPEAYTPVDRSTRAQPYGTASTFASVLITTDVTRPCDLACGAWVGHASGLAALSAAFTASSADFAAFLWVAIAQPVLLWLVLLLAVLAGCAARNAADVERAVAGERLAAVAGGMAGLRRTVGALQRRLRVYEASTAFKELR